MTPASLIARLRRRGAAHPETLPEEAVTLHSWCQEPESDLRSLTAASLLSKIELAEHGDTRELFALYRDLLASDSQVQLEFENRKRAVLGDTAAVLPLDKSYPNDVAAKDLCLPLLDSGPFRTAMEWLLNATLYPVAVAEKIYRPSAGGYALAAIVPVPYQLLDYASGTLRIRDVGPGGEPLQTSRPPDPDRYIVHRSHTLPLPDTWGGPMRSILFWILLRSMSRQWWADLLERYGNPFLKGKYADDKGKAVLERAFRLAQRLGGIVIHRNTEVEIVQAASDDSSNSHERFIELCSKEISKLVSGQTLSSNAEPTGIGSGAAPLQGQVRDDIRKSDAQRLASTLRSQLLVQYCRANGAVGRAPVLVFGSDSATETRALLATVASLGAAGLEPDDDALATLSERLGFGIRRKALPAASPSYSGAFPAFSARPLAAEPDAAGEMPEEILASIVRTSRTSGECLRRLRAALIGRPLDEQAEKLATAMDAYARRALSIVPDAEDTASPLAAENPDRAEDGKFAPKGTGDRTGGSSSSSSRKDPVGNGKEAAEDDTKSKDPIPPQDYPETEKASEQEAYDFVASEHGRISADKADRLLKRGFTVTDAEGKEAHFGALLLTHLDRHGERERNERKARLAFVKDLVVESVSIPTGKGKIYERIYRGESGGKIYLALADDHGEVNEIFSYRRDGK